MIEVRASSFGGCIKAQVAACLGYTPMDTPEHMQTVFDRGNVHEDENAAALRDSGLFIGGEQMEVIVATQQGSVKGHIDGMIADSYDTYVNEMGSGRGIRLWESKSPNAWAKFEKAHKTGTYDDPLTQRYAWQISVYMLALGLEAYVTCWDEEHGVRGFVIETPPYTMHDVELRLREIAEAVEVGTLPMLCSVRDYPCPFVYLHEDDVKVVEDEVLDNLVAQYLSDVRMEKRYADQKKEAQAAIRAHVQQNETVTKGGSKVTIYEQASAARYDMEHLRTFLHNRGYDLDEFLIPGKTSERIKITRQDGA